MRATILGCMRPKYGGRGWVVCAYRAGRNFGLLVLVTVNSLPILGAWQQQPSSGPRDGRNGHVHFEIRRNVYSSYGVGGPH